MRVIRKGEAPKQDATQAPIFVGGKVYRQPLVGNDISNHFVFNIVGFAAGARNRLHSHSSDQILFVTEGRGIVATEEEEVEIQEGDTALIPAGEKHWHGATPESDFAHIAVMAADNQTTIHG